MKRFVSALTIISTILIPLVSQAETPAFSISQITARSAIAGVRTVLNVHLSETAESCSLYVGGEKIKSMTIRDTVATTTHIFDEAKTYQATVECNTAAGVKQTGTMVSIVVLALSPNAKAGDLLKMACPAKTEVNHPCTTVYYYGSDGRRHAFPSERIFKTWYKDFSKVVVLSPAALSEIALGRNVTHKPTVKLVKFIAPTVYAVSYGGELRAIANEEIAKTLFGNNWVMLVEDVSDAFFSSYRIGRPLESSRDYESSKIRSAVDSIDDIL